MAKSSLNDMSIAALQSEIKRREKHANSLQKRREKLVKQLAEIDAEIAELGGVPGRGKGGRRPHLAPPHEGPPPAPRDRCPRRAPGVPVPAPVPDELLSVGESRVS